MHRTNWMGTSEPSPDPRYPNSEPTGFAHPRTKLSCCGFVPFSPLGFLTGKIDEDTKLDSTDFRNTVPRFNPQNRQTNQALVDLLSKFAQQKKATPAQLALAWLLASEPWIVPIPGTTKLHRLEENVVAANVDLTPEGLRAIEIASSNIKVEGDRYPQWVEQTTGR
jgi:aryl-alcohol dehydrogenase-like predicted oxidoreductase